MKKSKFSAKSDACQLPGRFIVNPRPLIASKAHTAILASIFVAMAIAGGYAQHAGSIQRALPTGHQMLRLDASVLLVEWASVFYVWKGIRRRNVVRLRELVGGRWQRPADIVADVALAALLWTAWVGIESAFPSSNAASGLLPRSALEAFVWIFVAFSAGVCEELVFRGYFQNQFLAMTGSVAAAIALQAFVFGIGHFYEGPWAVVKIILYGALFGMLAAWRRSLRPGMIAHVWSDLFGVVIFRS